MSSGKAACCGDTDPIYKVAYNPRTHEAHLYCVECGCEGHPSRVGRGGSVTLSIAAAVALEDNRYVAMLKNAGFTEWHTGGGCMAMGLTLPHHTILVTNQDSDVPQDNEAVSLGVYRNEPDGSWGEEVVEEFEGELAVDDLQALVEKYLATYQLATERTNEGLKR